MDGNAEPDALHYVYQKYDDAEADLKNTMSDTKMKKRNIVSSRDIMDWYPCYIILHTIFLLNFRRKGPGLSGILVED